MLSKSLEDRLGCIGKAEFMRYSSDHRISVANLYKMFTVTISMKEISKPIAHARQSGATDPVKSISEEALPSASGQPRPYGQVTGFVTLHDVARVAGVSHMTVSRVVRGVDSVSPKTARKVHLAVESTGYKPDPIMSALAAHRSPESGVGRKLLGLAFLDCDGSFFSRRVFEGAKEEALKYGYQVEHYPLEGGFKEARRMSRILYARGQRGLLFGPSDDERDLNGWAWQRFAAVSLGAPSHRPHLHAVFMDYFDGAWRGYHGVYKRGVKRIGLVIRPDLQARTGYRWLGGAAAAAASVGQPLWHYQGTFPLGSEYWEWVDEHQIEAVLSIDPATLQLGRERVRYVLFLNDWSAEHVQADVVLSIPPESIGREGVRFIHHLLLRREYGLSTQPRTVTVRGEWQTRQTMNADHAPG